MDIIGYLQRNKGILLHPQQIKAVEAVSGKTLLLAVPGSGKTTVLTARIMNLVANHGANPSSILTVTFSREAARDMEKRFYQLFGDVFHESLRFSTIHSLCYRILASYAKNSRTAMPKLIQGEERLSLLREIYRQINRQTISDEDLDYLSGRISFCKNTGSRGKENAFPEKNLSRPEEVFACYERYKKEQGRMDFDDMGLYALALLTKVSPLREAYARRYRHISLDEAQDTSAVQQAILKLLNQNSRSYFAVGDDDQSIYGFRGACPEQMLRFSQDYPGGTVLKLEQNFRSSYAIVKRADRFIRQNGRLKDKNMLCENRIQEGVTVKELPDYSRQYAEILRSLQEKGEGTAAVLYRLNDSAVPLADALLREGIPFYLKENRQSFFHSAVVRDIQAFLRLGADQKNLEAFGAIYYKLYCSRMMFEQVKEHIGRVDSVWEALLSIHGLPEYMKHKIARYERDFPALLLKPPVQAIRFIEQNLGYGSYMDAKMGNKALNRLRMQCLYEIAGRCRTVFDFLARLKELPVLLSDCTKNTGAPLTLSTVHSCKGLEFDSVYLLDLIDGVFPYTETEAPTPEEARLFYVAVTRAKRQLFLYRSHSQNGTDALSSRFLEQF